MRVDTKKMDLYLARECKTASSLRNGVSPQTLTKVQNGKEVRPITVGKIARLLNCDPEDLIAKEA